MLLKSPLRLQFTIKSFCHKSINIKTYKFFTASSVATAHSSTMSSNSECRHNKNNENAFHKSFIPPANLAASTTVVNGSEYFLLQKRMSSRVDL